MFFNNQMLVYTKYFTRNKAGFVCNGDNNKNSNRDSILKSMT
jgi:hypothetical protein